MIRTILLIGLFTLLALFAMKLMFGILVGAFGLLAVLLVWTFKLALIGGAVYLVIRIVSPATARKIRSGSE